jgi:hypothetical protein
MRRVEAIERQRARAVAETAATASSLGRARAPSASTEAGAPVGRRAALRSRKNERGLRGKHTDGGGDSAHESAEYGEAQEDNEALGSSSNDRSVGAAVDLSPRQHTVDPSVDMTGRECSRKKIGIRALLPSRSAVISPTASPSPAHSPSPSKSSPATALHEFNENRRRLLTRMVESDSSGDSEGRTHSPSASIRNALFGKDISAPSTPMRSKEEDRQTAWMSPVEAFC